MQRAVTCSLQDDFIRKVAEFIIDNYARRGKDVSRLAVVFGGKRPALFLKKALAKEAGKGFFSPRFFSMDEFVEYLVSKKELLRNISDLDACYAMYRITRKTAPGILKGKERFSQFIHWAREILSFVEQLDLEDVAAESLENIRLKATIGFDVPESINELLQSMVSVREGYHALLEKEKAYSRGLAYLRASRYVSEVAFGEFDDILFCGFFYLHKTEEDIIKHLYDAGKAVLLCQGDERDWSVLKKVSERFSCRLQSGAAGEEKGALSVFAGFDVHSEACLVREILKTIKKTSRLDRTVVVLPEPGHLIPLISEISAHVDDFNVSTGYPLTRGSLYSLFQCIFRAQETKKAEEYYTRDYLKAMSHPLIKNLKLSANPSVTRVLVHKIEEVLSGMEKTPLGGSLFVSLDDIRTSSDVYAAALKTMKTMDIAVTRDELKHVLRELHDVLFGWWEDVADFNAFSLSLEKFLDVLIARGHLGAYPLNLKMAERMFSIKEELKNASFSKEPFPKEEIYRIFDNKLNNEMVSFSGSPLKGLQVLGLLETRSLSFDKVIVMDVNETALPHLKVYEPLIPREVMISLGLNRLEKEEEIQRYQFRRLLASASDVYLVYQDRDDKEKSRFIEELIWEKQKAEHTLDVLPIPRAGFTVKVLPKRTEVRKNPGMLGFLKGRKYSSSSVNTYMHCPLRFYFQYVLGLEEKEDVREEPEGVDVGNFVHELLRTAFSVFLGRKPRIDKEFREEFLAALNKKFEEEFQKKMKGDAFLVKEVLKYRLERFLDHEAGRDVREILCLEEPFKGNIKFSCGTFAFKAIIDRIDRLSDGSILILDYKTGSTDVMTKGAGKIESQGYERESLKKTVKSFQLPLYLHFVSHDRRYRDSVANAALYSVRDPGGDSGLKKLFGDRDSAGREECLRVYHRALDAILSGILNPDEPFRADESNPRSCASCPFFYLCR